MTRAEEFYSMYVSRVTEVRFAELYRDNAAFTDVVIPEIGAIVQSMGFTAQYEYFRVDVIGWKSRWLEVEAEARACELNPHLWDLMIAVEHENDPADWTDELIKLAHLRCPLKVVIGYNHCDCREEAEQTKLRAAAKWLRSLRAFAAEEQEEYLIILGNCGAKHRKSKSYDRFDYRGYLYDPAAQEFRRI